MAAARGGEASGERTGATAAETATPDMAPGAWRAAAILSLFYWISQIDRHMMALLIPSIKEHFQASDFQVSLLSGLAFALFYMAFSLPIGWAADRFSRRWILFIGIAFWSLASIACGLARNVSQLFAARSAVGAGEATLGPCAYPLLADLFPPGRLTLALGIFTLGGTLGTSFAFMAGGPLLEWLAKLGPVIVWPVGLLVPWQLAFIYAGALGLFISFAAFLIPGRRDRLQHLRDRRRDEGGLSDFVACIRARPRLYICYILGFAMAYTAIAGIMVWNPALLSRTYGWGPAETGIWLGLSQLVASLVALAIQPILIDRMFRSGMHAAHLIWFCGATALAIPVLIVTYMSGSAYILIGGYGIFYFLMICAPSVGPAGLQIITPRAMRGKASSVYILVTGLLGAAIAPSIPAAITDFAFADESRLHLSLMIAGTGSCAVASLLFYLGIGPMRRVVAESAAAS